MNTQIVVHDPRGRFAIGTILEDASAQKEAAEGLILLPCDPELIYGQSASAAGGYVVRHWGLGVLYDGMRATRACPMLLHVFPGREWIHWAAMVKPDGDMRGNLTLVTNTAAIASMKGGLAQVDRPPALESLELLDGQEVIRGRCRIQVGAEGYLAMNLYGALTGTRVMWSAATQSRQP